eukprot:ctg_5322.g680
MPDSASGEEEQTRSPEDGTTTTRSERCVQPSPERTGAAEARPPRSEGAPITPAETITAGGDGALDLSAVSAGTELRPLERSRLGSEHNLIEATPAPGRTFDGSCLATRDYSTWYVDAPNSMVPASYGLHVAPVHGSGGGGGVMDISGSTAPTPTAAYPPESLLNLSGVMPTAAHESATATATPASRPTEDGRWRAPLPDSRASFELPPVADDSDSDRDVCKRGRTAELLDTVSEGSASPTADRSMDATVSPSDERHRRASSAELVPVMAPAVGGSRAAAEAFAQLLGSDELRRHHSDMLPRDDGVRGDGTAAIA